MTRGGKRGGIIEGTRDNNGASWTLSVHQSHNTSNHATKCNFLKCHVGKIVVGKFHW